MRVAIIGTGYVGLVTGACLAHVGHRVVCVDADTARVAALTRGETPIHESGLPELIREGTASGGLAATADLADAVRWAEITLICVGTPSEAGRIDLAAVREAARQIGAALVGRADYPVVVVKSTVVPGTSEGIVRTEIEATSGLVAGQGFGLAMNPEFLSQGSAVEDFLEPDRIVIGAIDERSAKAMLALYETFDCPKLVCQLVNAELVKYAANAFQATLISFSNQIASLCEHIPGADESTVMRGVHLDRILSLSNAEGTIQAPAARFLRGGIGFGGSCFPKDLLALQHFGREVGAPTDMLDAVIDTNHSRPDHILGMLRQELGDLAGKTIAVLGLAFKPGTDDLRESPGIALLQRLLAAGAVPRGHDPLALARDHARRRLPADIVITTAPEDALAGADAAILATAWPEYTTWDWASLGQRMRHPLLIDGRGLFDGHLPPLPVKYRRIGVGPLSGAHLHSQTERDQA